MSPRAACRLAQLGVAAYDYAGGKLDWLGRGGAYEGTGDLVARHLEPAVTCGIDETVGALAARAKSAPMCVVVTADGVVIGVVDRGGLEHHTDARVGEVTRFGPTTVRPSEERHALDERMSAKGVDHILVTDPDGRLLGLYRRLRHGLARDGTIA